MLRMKILAMVNAKGLYQKSFTMAFLGKDYFCQERDQYDFQIENSELDADSKSQMSVASSPQLSKQVRDFDFD